MASLGHFFSGFTQSFAQAKQQKKLKEEEEQEKKARLKLFELQMGREKRLQAQQDQEMEERKNALRSRNDLFNTIKQKTSGVVTNPLPGTGVQLGDVEQTMAAPKPLNLAEALADPEVFLKSMQAGVPLPQQPVDPNAELIGQMNNPALKEFVLELRRAGTSSTNINLGNEGLSKPPPGYSRPDPSEPGLEREEGGPPTPGQESLDKAFGTDAAAWVAAGGFADTQKSIAQLGEAKAALEAVANGTSEAQLTGPLVARLPGFAKPLFNPAAVAVRESVEEIVQRNLRLVLGAQFTEKEGERLIARAYNENLSEAENAKRVSRLMKQLGDAARAKQEAVDYFNENGTLEGFKGKVWTLADFEPESAAAPKGKTIDFSELPD